MVNRRRPLRDGHLAGRRGRRRTGADVLAAVGRLVAQSRAPELVGQRVADAVRQLLDVENAAVHRLDRDTGALVAVAVSGDAGTVLGEWVVFPRGTGLVGLALQRRRPVATADVLADRRVTLTPDLRTRIERAGYRAVLAVPLLGANGPLGALGLGARRGRRFTRGEIQLVQRFAELAAAALEHEQLDVRHGSHLERLQTLTRLNQLVIGPLDLDTVLREIARAAAALMEAPFTSFWLVDTRAGTLTLGSSSDEAAARDFGVRVLRVGEGGVGWVAEHRAALAVPDVTVDPRISDQAWWRRHGYTSWLGVPVLLDGEPTAVLALCGRRPFVLDEDNDQLLASFAAHAAVAIRNARLHRDLEQRLGRLHVLTRLNRVITSSLQMDEVLREIARAAATLVPGAIASFALVDRAAGTIELRAWSDEAVGAQFPRRTLRFDEGVLGWVATRGELLKVDDAQADPRMVGPAWLRAHGLTSYLGLPVTLEGRLLAILSLNGRAPFVLSDEDRDLLEAFVGQAAVAIRNAGLYQAAERGQREAEVIAQVARTINSALDLESILRQVTDAARDLCQADAAKIGLYDPVARALRFVYWPGSTYQNYATLRIEPGRGLGGHVLVSGRPIRTRSYTDDPRFAKDYARVNEADGVLADLVVPIGIGETVAGLLYVSHRTPREFTDHDETLVVRLAEHAAVAITNTRLLETSTAGRRRAEALAELGRTLVETLDPIVASRRTAEHARGLLGAQNAAAFRLDERGELVLIASSGDTGPALVSDLVLPRGHGAAGLAVSARGPRWTGNVLEDPRITLSPEMRTRFEQSPHRAVLAVPLFVHDDVVGALSVGDRRGRTFAPDDVALLQAFAAQAALALENARLHAESERQRREAEVLAEVGRAIGASLDVENVLAMITERVCALLGTQRSAVALLPEGGQATGVELIAASRGLSEQVRELRPAHPRDGTVIAAITEGRAVWSADLLNDSAFDLTPATRALVEREGYRAVLSVPLTVGEQTLGALLACRDEVGPFSQQQVDLLQAFADQAALALQNAHLYQEAERRRREAEELARTARTLTERLDVGAVGERIVEGARTILGASSAILRLVQTDGSLVGVASTGAGSGHFEPGHVLPRGEGVTGTALLRGEPQRVVSLEKHLAFVHTPDLRARVAKAGHRAILAVPLRAKGRSVGVLSIADQADRDFTASEVALAQAFADQAALGLENARLFEDAERRRRETEVLAALAQAISASLDLDTVLRRVAEGAKDLTRSDIASIDLGDPVRHALSGRYCVGGRQPAAILGDIPPGHGLTDKIMESGRPLRTASDAEDPAINRESTTLMLREEGVVTGLGVPVTIDGRTEGVLAVWNRVARPFTDHDEARLQRLADQAAIAIKNAHLFARERESERRYRELVEGSLQGIHIHRDWVTLFANLTFARMLGYEDPTELLGVDARRFVAPEELPRVEAWAAARLHGEAAPARHEYRGLTHDGTTIWLEVQPSVIRWEGEPAILATFVDITERRRAEEALRQSEAQLRQVQKMEAVGRLAGGIAHDFNNLLTVITGRSELLLMRLPADDPRRRDIELITRTAGRAATLTRQLLAFSRKQMLQPRTLDLNEVVAGMAQMLERLIGEHIELVTMPGLHLGLVRADPAQLEQVVLNLAVNARDAMPHGGRLTLSTANVELDEEFVATHPGARVGPHAMLCVTDTGAGMSPEVLAHLFEPFFTTKEVGKGTGLGLATVYGIVKQHDGYVHVHSVPGEGTAVQIYLQRVAPHEPAEGLRDWREQTAHATGTILLVEDEDALRELAAEVLQAAGYTVLAAADPGIALELAAAHDAPIDLLLTDVVMPLMSGRDLAEHLCSGRPDMRVLYMSGYTDDAIVHHGVLEADTELLQKPFTPANLTDKVRRLLA